jgi:hypothetical protein
MLQFTASSVVFVIFLFLYKLVVVSIMSANTTNERRGVDETSPLLGDPSSISPEVQDQPAANGDEDENAGYNQKQVLLLSVCALADPISFFVIVPFVPQMIFELGIKESKVGFYAGLIVSEPYLLGA